jgi:nucleoside-diphosphate-sugar epimerase
VRIVVACDDVSSMGGLAVIILVTGAAGYIGGHLCNVLRERGHELHTQDRQEGPAVDKVFDLGIPEMTRWWLRKYKPDVVIHLAALYGRVWGEKNLRDTVDANVGITAMLAQEVAAVGARMMFMSSSEVYGMTATAERGDILTSMDLRPLNMYGLSKKWGEEACELYAPDGLMITRLNMPYGPAAFLPKPGVTPKFSGRVGMLGYNAMHIMLWQAYHGLPITIHKGCKRCFTYVGDTCRGLAMIAESGKSGKWNVNRNDQHITTSQLASRCMLLVPGCRSHVTEIEPDDQITLKKALDSDRLWQMGWRPEKDLEEGMKETLDYVSRFDAEGWWQG